MEHDRSQHDRSQKARGRPRKTRDQFDSDEAYARYISNCNRARAYMSQHPEVGQEAAKRFNARHPERAKAYRQAYYYRTLGAVRAVRRQEREASKREQQAHKEQRLSQRDAVDGVVLQMRADGKTFAAIAQALGLAGESSAFRRWQSAKLRKH